MRFALKLTVLLSLLAIPLWRGRNFLHRQYRDIAGMCTTHLAEALIQAHLEDSPHARSFLTSFAQFDCYLPAKSSFPPNADGRVVFYGDSIIDFWPTAYPKQFFPGPQYIGRGTSGQSTPELVWCLQPNALDLHPATLVLLAGTNDVIQPKRHISLAETERNLQTMAELAGKQHIYVILCSVLPVAHFPQPQQAAYTEEIQSLNQWLKTYATQQHLAYVDLYSAMANNTGSMQDSYSPDGIHPNAAGYQLMHLLTEPAIDSPTISAATSPPTAQ